MKKKICFFAYNPPTSGIFSVNGFKYQSGEDFRSVKRCKEYKNCGFDKLQLRYEYAYNGEDFENSQTKYMWDIAYKAGIKKILVTDLRIDKLIAYEKLLGKDGLFETRSALDEKILEYVSIYKDKAGFYGLQILDEPRWKMVPAYGEVVQSLKRVLPNAYVQVNLAPVCISIDGIEDAGEAYETYAKEMLDRTGLDHISFDDYPFRREYILSGWNIRNYQILARLCKERNIQLQTVLQSFSNMTDGILRHRKITEKDMYWQANVAMGFGAREIAFYTYMPKYNLHFTQGGDGIDGACFINNDGSRSALFYYTKRIIKEMQRFAPVLLKYTYENSYFVCGQGTTKEDFEHTMLAEDNGKPPFEISVDKGVALITHQKNGENLLYMIENIGNIKDEIFNAEKPMQVQFTLPNGKKKFYFHGKRVGVKQENGVFSRALSVGDALFIEIKK